MAVEQLYDHLLTHRPPMLTQQMWQWALQHRSGFTVRDVVEELHIKRSTVVCVLWRWCQKGKVKVIAHHGVRPHVYANVYAIPRKCAQKVKQRDSEKN